MLDIYLPIADLKIDLLILLLIGFITGMLSGLFGVGGGIIAVPALTFFCVPPQVAVASVTNQMTAGTLSAYISYSKHGRVDYALGILLLIGGFFGNVLGMLILKILSKTGQTDIVISLGFLILLSFVGYTTIKDAIITFHNKRKKAQRPHREPLFYAAFLKLPFKQKFISSNYKSSIIVVLTLGVIAGMLVILLGIGGAFVVIPAMLHILKIDEAFVTGTMLFQLIFTSLTATIFQAVGFNGVDIVLSFLLIIGTVLGSLIGAKIGLKINKDDFRIVLGIVILFLCIGVAQDVFFEPEEKYKIMRVIK